MTQLEKTKPHLYKKLTASAGIGALALSLAACGDNGDDDDNGTDETTVEDSDNGDNGDAEASDADPFDDPDFVAERANSFFTDAGEVGVDYDQANEITSEEEQLEWAEENYQDIVGEYFDVDEDASLEDLEDEYMLTMVAATYSEDMGEATGGVIEMDMSPPEFLGSHTEINADDETAVSPAFFLQMMRDVDQSGEFEEMSDEEMADELAEQPGATIPVHLEYAEDTWYIDANSTLVAMEDMTSFTSDDGADADADTDTDDNIVGDDADNDES